MMASQQLRRYGSIAVGQTVEYERFQNPLKNDSEIIRTIHTVTAIRECDTGALITLKGQASTIVHAFDVAGRVWGGGFGGLRVLEDSPSQLSNGQMVPTQHLVPSIS